jgi:hypothetical protein
MAPPKCMMWAGTGCCGRWQAGRGRQRATQRGAQGDAKLRSVPGITAS